MLPSSSRQPRSPEKAPPGPGIPLGLGPALGIDRPQPDPDPSLIQRLPSSSLGPYGSSPDVPRIPRPPSSNSGTARPDLTVPLTVSRTPSPTKVPTPRPGIPLPIPTAPPLPSPTEAPLPNPTEPPVSNPTEPPLPNPTGPPSTNPKASINPHAFGLPRWLSSVYVAPSPYYLLHLLPYLLVFHLVKEDQHLSTPYPLIYLFGFILVQLRLFKPPWMPTEDVYGRREPQHPAFLPWILEPWHEDAARRWLKIYYWVYGVIVRHQDPKGNGGSKLGALLGRKVRNKHMWGPGPWRYSAWNTEPGELGQLVCRRAGWVVVSGELPAFIPWAILYAIVSWLADPEFTLVRYWLKSVDSVVRGREYATLPVWVVTVAWTWQATRVFLSYGCLRHALRMTEGLYRGFTDAPFMEEAPVDPVLMRYGPGYRSMTPGPQALPMWAGDVQDFYENLKRHAGDEVVDYPRSSVASYRSGAGYTYPADDLVKAIWDYKLDGQKVFEENERRFGRIDRRTEAFELIVHPFPGRILLTPMSTYDLQGQFDDDGESDIGARVTHKMAGYTQAVVDHLNVRRFTQEINPDWEVISDHWYDRAVCDEATLTWAVHRLIHLNG